MSASSALFAPARLGAVSLSNRIIMAPLTRSRADPMGVPTPPMLDYYSQRASAGLIISEGVQPSYAGQGYPRTPGIHTDEQIGAWRAITDAVHAKGGKMFCQIMHAGRVAHKDNRQIPDDPVAPSAVPPGWPEMYSDKAGGMVPMGTPRALETSEIPGVIDEFVTAAKNAVAAGFDGVELHAANGYLLHQFLSTNTNLRTDEYGGSAGKRVRLAVETYAAVSEAIGAGRTGMRISPGHMFNDLVDEAPMETHGVLLGALPTHEMAYVHVMLPDAFSAELNNSGAAEGVLPTLRRQVQGNLLAAGQLDLAKAQRLLEQGLVDFPVFGRPFIANPDLVARLRAGRALAEPDPEFFYAGGARGYSDYPALSE